MITPAQSLRAVLGADSEGNNASDRHRYWNRKREYFLVPMELQGSRFGSVIQRQRVVIRRKGEPIRYGALYCTGCKRPLHRHLTIAELMALRYHPEDGCGSDYCSVRTPLSRVKSKQADMPNLKKVAVNLSLYKLLLPELVPTTYGGNFGFPSMQPAIPTDKDTAKRFCKEMGISPDAVCRKFFLHLGQKEEALIPQHCQFNSVVPEVLINRMQDFNFTLKVNKTDLTYFDLEELQPGLFMECALKFISPKQPEELFDKRTEAMNAVFKKVEIQDGQNSTRTQAPAATQFYSSFYNALCALQVDEVLEVANLPAEVTLGNLYHALKRRGLHASKHYGFNKRIFTEDGMRLPKESRIYLARKLEEFPKNNCNRQ
jgi:hypothetical protein